MGCASLIGSEMSRRNQGSPRTSPAREKSRPPGEAAGPSGTRRHEVGNMLGWPSEPLPTESTEQPERAGADQKRYMAKFLRPRQMVTPSRRCKSAWLHPKVAATTSPNGVGTRFRGPHVARSASFTRAHLQLGKAIVGAPEPPTKLAVDILQHDYIPVDVGLVALVKLLGRELVQLGWALRDDRG